MENCARYACLNLEAHVKWIVQGKGREIVELLRQPETSMAIADNIAIMKGMPPQTLFVCAASM